VDSADHDKPANFEHDEALPTASFGNGAIGPGEQIGPYKLLRILGEGGYGIVYLAEQQRPVKRRVALKVIKPGMDTKQVIARFEAERQALALLDHPNIAHVFNAGTTDAGRPYFAMEYVKGDPITEHCDRYKLTIEERLELFMRVCEAVQYAHQKAIIHRDIKPSNILVAFEAEQAVPMIIDFGVAKALSQSLTERTLVTEHAQMVGTPEYMSPEQAEMTGQDIDTRTDVYSLGALLYELLTGTLPFDPQTLREGGPEQMRRLIREQDPQTPSVRLSTIENEKSANLAQQRRTDIRTLGHHLHGDLDWITLKAMDKDRTRRYQTAHALAEDIQRYLKQEPVLACPPSTTYKFRKFVTRNKGLAIGTLAVTITLLLGIVGTTVGLVIANRERARAETSAEAAREARYEAENHSESKRRLLYVSNMNLAIQAWEVGDLDHMIQLLDQHRQPPPNQEDLRGFEWYYLWRLWRNTYATPILKHEASVSHLAFSPDGRTLASACGEDILLWNPTTKRQRYVLKEHTGEVTCTSFSADGQILASGSKDGTVILWDTTTGKILHKLEGDGNSIHLVAFNADDKILTSWSLRRKYKWNTTSGEKIDSLNIEKVDGRGNLGIEALSPDGKTLAIKSDVDLVLQDVISGSKTKYLKGHKAYVLCAAFSPDGDTIATGSNDSTIIFWDLATHQKSHPISIQSNVTSVAFSPDDKTLAAGCGDSTVTLWDRTANREITVLKGHTWNVSCLAFSPQGKLLASGSTDKTVRLWDITYPVQDCTILREHLGYVSCVAISPDGDKLASVGNHDGMLRFWNINTAKQIKSHQFEDIRLWSVDFSPDSKTLAIGTDANEGVILWDITTWQRIDSLPGSNGSNYDVTFSRDRKMLAASCGGKGYIWNVEERRQISPPISMSGFNANTLAFSLDSKTLAIGALGHVVLWDVSSNKEVGQLKASGSQTCVTFSSNDNILASGSDNGTVTVSNVPPSEEGRVVLGKHMSTVKTVAFSLDGKTLASGGKDGTIKIWNLIVNKEVATIRCGTGWITSLVFCPDHKTLISSHADSTIRLWQAATEEEVLTAEAKSQNSR